MRKCIRVNPTRRRNLSTPRRFTLTEAVVILAVAMVFTAILVPTLRSQGKAGDILQARQTVQDIGEAIRRYHHDTNHLPGSMDFTGGITGRSGRKVQVLVSGGNTPRLQPHIGTEAWGEAPSERLDVFLIAVPLDYVRTSPSRAIWKGPYIDPIDADPWGNCYMVNIGLQEQSADAVDARSGRMAAIYVISAGPNGILETPYYQSVGDASTRGDDIAHRLQ